MAKDLTSLSAAELQQALREAQEEYGWAMSAAIPTRGETPRFVEARTHLRAVFAEKKRRGWVNPYDS